MKLPKPEAGLVICYSYLWAREHQAGRDERIKDRPCAIVLATEDKQGKTDVLVVPVTHAPPGQDAAALEVPPALKRHLGLDSDRSWIVYSEATHLRGRGRIFAASARARTRSLTACCPPNFGELKRRFLDSEAAARSRRVIRTE